MKKKITLMTSLAASMILTGNVWAGSCGQGCSWEKNGTKLVITATDGAVMDDFSEHWNADRQVYETTAPWGADVTEVEIIGGLTNISRSAFEGANLTSINIPSSVVRLGEDSFSWNNNLTSVSIPSSVTSIDKWAFARTPSLMDMIIPSSVTNIGEVVFTGSGVDTVVVENANATISANAFGGMSGTKVYCQSFEQCANKGIADSNIMLFNKTEDGVYQIGTGDDAKYFASSSLMVAGDEKACSSLEQCQGILAAIQDGKNFRIGDKLYSSINDFLSGKNIQKRIYTVEEATKLSKPTGNKIMIRYK